MFRTPFEEMTLSCVNVIDIVFPLDVTVAPVRDVGRGTGAVNVRVITVPVGIVCVFAVVFCNDKNSEPVWAGQERVALRPKDKVAENAEGAISAAKQQTSFNRVVIRNSVSPLRFISVQNTLL